MKNTIFAIILCAICTGCSGCYSARVQNMIDRADAAVSTNAPAQEVYP